MPAHKKTNVSPEERARLDKRQALKSKQNAKRVQDKVGVGIPTRKKPRPYNYRSKTPPVGPLAVHRLVERAIATAVGKARARERCNDWRLNNVEHKKGADALCYERNRKVVIARSTEWNRANRQAYLSSNPEANLRARVRSRFHSALNTACAGKIDNTVTLIGSSFRHLFEHLNKQLGKGEELSDMHHDHIFPLSRHDLNGDQGQYRAMHYSNLQPLTQLENISKSAKLPTKAMAAKVERWAWPDGVTEDMLPDIYPGWATALRK
jgi:hypothetical protein